MQSALATSHPTTLMSCLWRRALPNPKASHPTELFTESGMSSFKNSFRDAAQKPNFARHHFAAIVLSNFRTLTSEKAGGLSGVFMPIPPKYKRFHADVIVSCWGRPKTDMNLNNKWSRPDDDALVAWSSLGFVAALDPFSEPADASVKIFGFTIQRLPRDNTFWGAPESLTLLEVRVGRRDQAGNIKFSKRDESHVD